MKRTLTLAMTAGTLVLAGCVTPPQTNTWKQTYSSFDLPADHPAKELGKRYSFDKPSLPLPEALKLYEDLSRRTVIAGKLPDTTLSLRTALPVNRIEALQLLDSVLAQHRIAMVLSGDKAVKAVPVEKAVVEGPPEITLPWQELPESSSLMSRTVHVKHFRPSEILPMLAPYSNLPGGMVAVDAEHMLLLREYSSAIRQQLKLLEELEQKQSAK